MSSECGKVPFKSSWNSVQRIPNLLSDSTGQEKKTSWYLEYDVIARHPKWIDCVGDSGTKNE